MGVKSGGPEGPNRDACLECTQGNPGALLVGLQQPKRSAELESYPGQGGLVETKLSGCGPPTASFSLVNVPCPGKLPGIAERAVAYVLLLAHAPAVRGVLDQFC